MSTAENVEQQSKTQEQIFTELEGGQLAENERPTEVESLCMNCHSNGITRLLFTKIPHFREIILMSFECEECGFKNHEVSFGGSFAEHGIKITFKVTDKKDLNRQIVKSDSATVTIPELDFEIPANTQKGLINTLEGLFSKSIEALSEMQPVRRIQDPETAAKIDAFIEKLQKTCIDVENGPYTIILDDPAGNSNIENIYAPKPDPNMTITHYKRTKEQNHMLGLGLEGEFIEQNNPDAAAAAASSTSNSHAAPQQQQQQKAIVSEEEAEKLSSKVATPQEVMIFPEKCYNCSIEGELKMVVTDIPYFKQVVLMAFTCDRCGYKSTEVRAGGAIPPKGKKITLKVTNPDDLSRDILKSETASVYIPEIDLEITHGSMGGKFTTIEGLLNSLKTQLKATTSFSLGDSAQAFNKEQITAFFDALSKLEAGETEFTIIIDDPMANSYIQNLYAPDPDPNMVIEEYERSFEQNEELGLNDIKVEGYAEEEQQHEQQQKQQQQQQQ